MLQREPTWSDSATNITDYQDPLRNRLNFFMTSNVNEVQPNTKYKIQKTTGMKWDVGKTQHYQAKRKAKYRLTHIDKWSTYKLHTERLQPNGRLKPNVFLLRGNSSNHHTTVLP